MIVCFVAVISEENHFSYPLIFNYIFSVVLFKLKTVFYELAECIICYK